MKYLLSIIIPTRNRQKYALAAIQQIYKNTDDRVQIVVQDNSDDDSLKDMIQKNNVSNRVYYNFVDYRIPGVENYGRGIQAARGDYVCCIGDDDGVMRYISEVVEWAKEHDVDAIKPGTQAIYFWPGVTNVREPGILHLYNSTSAVHESCPKKNIVSLVKNGGQNYLSMDLVKAYHGIVKRELFDRIYEKTGKYCGGLSPDMYLCTSLSLIVDKLVCLDMPMTIGGVCRQSTSGDSANRINFGPLDSAPHFVGQEYTWSDKVPVYYCGQTIWADTMMHALDDNEATELREQFGIEAITAYCLAERHGYDECIMDNFKKNHGDINKLKKLIKKRKNDRMVLQIKKFIIFFMKLFRKEIADIEIKGVGNIIDAEEIFFQKLQGKFEQLMIQLRSQY